MMTSIVENNSHLCGKQKESGIHLHDTSKMAQQAEVQWGRPGKERAEKNSPSITVNSGVRKAGQYCTPQEQPEPDEDTSP